MTGTLKTIFLGPDGKLRFLWRAAIFYAGANWVLTPLLIKPSDWVSGLLGLKPGLTPGNIAVSEIATFLIALILTGLFALYEHRRVDSYGLPVDRAFQLPTWEGALAGIAMAGAVAAGMLLLGGMQIKGLATAQGPIWMSAAAWLAANICIGIAEEAFYRGYFLQALWKSIGFWPAAVVIAAGFAADHYFYKPGENIWDVITLVSLSLLLSYSLLKTGSLWFAVGFHIAFDFMQLFVIGTPNGSQLPVGRLLDVGFQGPWWLTGGALGTEASFLMYPAIALLWLYVWRRYPSPASLP